MIAFARLRAASDSDFNQRDSQLYRSWPETGRLQALGTHLFYATRGFPVRAFPDGEAALALPP